MRIALFDYRVIPTNPVGSCHLRMLAGLCDLHDFTVFAVEFQNPRPDRIRWVRIPLPVRPYVLLYALFHLAAPLAYLWHRFLRGAQFDLVQMVESNLSFGDISYSHFCHRWYLAEHWRETRARGLLGLSRGLAHRAAAAMEPAVYRRVRRIVAPSRGLVSELRQTYHLDGSRIRILPNAVDVERLAPPDPSLREQYRQRLGYATTDFVLLFAALGHFERKGLPLAMDALRDAASSVQLLVAGGEAATIREHQERARALGVDGRVRFAGMQRDLRPYYWAADAFILPSCYEVFPLVALEAAAAGLPLLVTKVNGVEEILLDGENGVAIERDSASIRRAIGRLTNMALADRQHMGARAREAVLRYGSDHFVSAWKEFYECMA